jgi:hypothetical protein
MPQEEIATSLFSTLYHKISVLSVKPFEIPISNLVGDNPVLIFFDKNTLNVS